MPSATRQKLVEAATKRFYRDGFRNVGIDQILSDVGISKTAFYKYFECKEDLVLAALTIAFIGCKAHFWKWSGSAAAKAA